MKSPFESTLRTKLEEMDAMLASKGYALSIHEDAWQEYAVTAECFKHGASIGKLRLYYAPTKKTFRYDCRSLKDIELTSLLNEKRIGSPSGGKREHKGLHAYVDGSYIAGNVGYGLAIINDDALIFEDFGSVNNPEYLEARQVAGELMAVGKVVQWCKQHGHASITIHYDYAGIREWALGNWRAKQALTQRYAQFMALSGLLINWNKIQAHTGDHWNEYVDKLAKKGTGQ
ncbi:MAG: RNase H family protein [bacterium]